MKSLQSGLKNVGDIAFVEYGEKVVPVKSPAGLKTVPHTKIGINPGEIETAAKVGSWWHELAHPRTRGIGPAAESPELELAELAAGMSKRMPYWLRPSEQISNMMQLLLRDPQIIEKTLSKGVVDPNKYDLMYNLALKRALTQNINPETMRSTVFGLKSRKVPVTGGD